MNNDNDTPVIMLVDDTPANLRFLQQIMHHAGYAVAAFPRGELALKAAQRKLPDLILLDIMMPDMDGFEVCRQLKADPRLEKIPVLFLSALTDQSDKVRAFAAGGVDYITKPFDENEILVRVRTHLKLNQLSRKLEDLVDQRTRQLKQTNAALEKEIVSRKAAQERLSENQALLRSVFEGITDPLVLVDVDMRIQLFNRAAASYYRRLGPDLKAGDILCRGKKPVPCSRCNLPRFVSEGRTVSMEREGLTDPEKIEKVMVYPVKSDNTRPGSAVIHIQDITEVRRLFQEMAQADKLIALGTLVAGVAHEINNPNHVIQLNAPILSQVWEGIQPVLDNHARSEGDFSIAGLPYSQLKQDLPHLISDIGSSADRIKRIVSVLKDYSVKNEHLVLDRIQINQVIENALLLMRYKAKSASGCFQVSYGRDLPALKADQQKLEQVFFNLLDNALDALPDTGKKVFVETSHDNAARQIVVTVRDQGVGMPSDQISRITDPFFTTKREKGGTGLGLSIVQRIVSLHRGHLDIHSTPGSGATFTVRLPL
jgi:signal transduction histidine kinase/DNA-binding response OmpR family regulator